LARKDKSKTVKDSSRGEMGPVGNVIPRVFARPNTAEKDVSGSRKHIHLLGRRIMKMIARKTPARRVIRRNEELPHWAQNPTPLPGE